MSQTAKALVCITFEPDADTKIKIENVLSNAAEIVYLKDKKPEERAENLKRAKAVLVWTPHQELSKDEEKLLENVSFMQLLSAGADHLDFSRLPAQLTIASNVGAYARPMAEHVLAMALALSKKLFFHHQNLKSGYFDQVTENKLLFGSTASILGFGGIGRETARLFKVFDMHILAINRSRKTSEQVDFLGTLENLDEVLPKADILVITLPLNKSTRKLIKERELKLMKPDAVLVNVGRGEIIDEDALYNHLKNTPSFMAGIDSWWIEPFRHGKFEMKHPFLDLPNVIGTPHNSALVPGAVAAAAQKAAENIKRFLSGEQILGIVRPEDYI